MSAAAERRNPPERIDAGDGVEVRRSLPEDAEAVAAAVGENLEHLAPWLPWANHEAATTEAQRARLEANLDLWSAGTDYGYAVWHDGRLAGFMGLHRRLGPGRIELGYWLRSDSTGRGVATAAAGALTDAALALPDVEQIEIHCDEANDRSAAVPRRLGYRLDRIEDAEITAPAETGRKMIWVKTLD